MTSTSTIDLAALPQLAELFRWFSGGKHLNRIAEPALWAELEREQEAYQALFTALGYDFRLDGRGFAWFHTEEASSTVNKTTRQLALLFMVLFDTQADAGKALTGFDHWVIDGALLRQVLKQHQELLLAEGLDLEGLKALCETATRFGFAVADNGQWRLLPAVCRYLDHFEALAEHHQQAKETLTELNDLGSDGANPL